MSSWNLGPSTAACGSASPTWKRSEHPPFVRGTTDRNCMPWPGPKVTTCMSYLTTGGPGKERGTNKLPPTGKIRERSKGERRHQSICPANLPESFTLESILAGWCACHQEGPWVRVIGQRQPQNKPHYHKTRDCEPCGRAVLLGSITLLLYALAPFLNKVSCFVSMRVSSDNSFPSVRQEPTLRPWKGSPFLQHCYWFLWRLHCTDMID